MWGQYAFGHHVMICGREYPNGTRQTLAEGPCSGRKQKLMHESDYCAIRVKLFCI
jgi:hypothetical protein